MHLNRARNVTLTEFERIELKGQSWKGHNLKGQSLKEQSLKGHI